jgi:hypothetical protein
MCPVDYVPAGLAAVAILVGARTRSDDCWAIPEFRSRENAIDLRLSSWRFVNMYKGTCQGGRNGIERFTVSVGDLAGGPDDGRCTRAAGRPARRLSPKRGTRPPRAGRVRAGDAGEGMELRAFEDGHPVGIETIAGSRCSRANERVWSSAPPKIRRPPSAYRGTGLCGQLVVQVR